MNVSILDGPIARQLAAALDAISQKPLGTVVNCEGLKIKKTFPSVADMEAYTGDDLVEGDFVMIISSDEDNGNAYLKSDDGYLYVSNFANAADLVNASPISSIEIQNIFDTI